MNTRKNRLQRGFTLVEVIVVAVIVAILAGVSVPLYLGYINNSRENAAANAAGSAASFAAACVNTGKDIDLAENTTRLGVKEGTAKLVCGSGTDAPSLVIPTDIVLKRYTNAITGKHNLGGSESQQYIYTTATTTGTGGGGTSGGGTSGGG